MVAAPAKKGKRKKRDDALEEGRGIKRNAARCGACNVQDVEEDHDVDTLQAQVVVGNRACPAEAGCEDQASEAKRCTQLFVSSVAGPCSWRGVAGASGAGPCSWR